MLLFWSRVWLAYQEFAKRAPDDSVDVERHVLIHLRLRPLLPFAKDYVAARIDLLNVMIHVFNVQNVVVQSLLVFGVCANTGDSWRLCSHGSWAFFGNDLQRLEHGLVDL